MDTNKSNMMIQSPFESNRDIIEGDESIQNMKTMCALPTEYDIFQGLLDSGDEMDKDADMLIEQIISIKKDNQTHMEKNLTFKLLFDSVSQTLKEYKSQTLLFTSYTKAYEGLCNEENVVKVLDILREILKERKSILNDIINNVIKIQKLTNERIKIDMSDEEDDLGEFVDPDEI